LLRFPVLAKFDCDTCQKFMVDYDWQDHSGTGRVKKCGGGRMDQPRVVPPPCDRCPKISPAHEHEFVLSDKNRRALEFYREVRATCGRRLTEEMLADRTLVQNLTLIDSIVRPLKA